MFSGRVMFEQLMMYVLVLIQLVKKNRDPRWGEEFQFTLEEPPTSERLHVEVLSSSKMSLLHPKVYTLR